MTRDKRCHTILRLLTVLFFAAVCVWGITEAGYGLLQVLGWRMSRHSLYALTGHFNNPGPYGGFIACVMAVATAWVMRSRVKPSGLRMTTTWIMYILAWVTIGMGTLVLPASMSRAGWLAQLVALAVEAIRMPQVREWIRKHRWMIPAGGAGVIALLVGAFLIKPESALGRLHIWRMECRAIAERPWTGAGPGMGAWAYGEAQEAFFRARLETASPTVVRVAGCPEYAFNEFLGIGVEYGVPGLLLSVLLVAASIAVLYKARSPFAAGLTAWSVFACASYPLSVPQLRLLGAGFVLIALVVGILQVRSWRMGVLPVIVAGLLAGWMGFRVKPGMTKEWLGTARKENFRAVYAQGYALHQAGRYAESTEILEWGTRMSCDPMFEIILGKNAEALGDDTRAEALYEKAHYMVPSRLYPLVRLMRLQVRTGRNREALETARRIVMMPVNERHEGMVKLREETEVTLDSLEIALRKQP
ncbi:MAG: O-antigen ligase family protein [Bacteroidales bacterium]|nr:O-antigen ligase family protein [Bacteroidales bacterium]